MASPDKTPLERLSWLQRQAEPEPCFFVRAADLDALEAEVVRLQEREAELLVQRDELQREVRQLRATGDDRG